MPKVESRLIDMQSEFVSDTSQMRVKVEQFKDKIVVNVMEVSSKYCSKERAVKCAIKAARRVGVSSVDYIRIAENEIIRNSHRLDEAFTPVRTRVRTTVFVFDGVE